MRSKVGECFLINKNIFFLPFFFLTKHNLFTTKPGTLTLFLIFIPFIISSNHPSFIYFNSSLEDLSIDIKIEEQFSGLLLSFLFIYLFNNF